jgi:hypothetical protein
MVTRWPRTGFAISQRILLLFLISDERRYPYDRALMKLCSDLHGRKKPLSTPPREIMDSDFGHLRIPTIREEEQGHF